MDQPGARGAARPPRDRRAARLAKTRAPADPPSPAGPAAAVAPARSTAGLALAGCVLLWAAQPPLDLWPLAWLAAVPWVLLIRRDVLAGRRPYLILWSAACAYWLATLHWLRLPHWGTAIGGVALSAYLAVYLPLFVGLGRVAVRRLGVPLLVAAPTIYAGLELARAHVLTGFSMGSIAHPQRHWLLVAQVADLGGEYLLSFLIVLVAACLARMLPLRREAQVPAAAWSWWPLGVALAALAAALAYGSHRLRQPAEEPALRVALIQGSIDTEVKEDPQRSVEVFRHYFDLSLQAVHDHRPQLLVWPETMYRQSMITFDPDAALPPRAEISLDQFRQWLPEAAAEAESMLAKTVAAFGVPSIIGVETTHYGSRRTGYFNSAYHLDGDGRILGRYDKLHPVMFGEYIPFARYLPWLYRITPLSAGLDAGPGPAAFVAGRLRLAPSICYESVLAHVIRGQVQELRRRRQEPDVLVNLTNDGWFRGSSELDMHLACGVFRAIECRKPLLIAANTGFSAWIDGDGRVVRQGPRRQPGVVVADVRTDRRSSPYLLYGDLPAGGCLVFAAICAAAGLWGRRRASAPVQAA